MRPTDGRGGRAVRAACAALLALCAAMATAAPAPVEDGGTRPATTAPAAPPVAPDAPAAPRIGIVTMEPGAIFFERFGHNAIVVDDPAGGRRTAYNYGYFDMDEPDFFGRFLHGEMMYWLVELPLEQDLAYYAEVGRGATVQWLDLPPDAVRALAARLHADARGENARYRYDYYTANCSTKVRDAIDAATGGTLRPQLQARSQGNTWRSESVRLAAPAPWMAIGFHLGLTAYADRPLSRWEEAFVPMRLRDALREAKLPDGRPLVLAEEVLLPHRIGQPPAEMPALRGEALVAGLVLAFAVLWSGRRYPRALAASALAFWTIAGLAGATMLFIWFGTAHVAGHGNLNLLLLNPLAWALLPGGWARLRGRPASPRFRAILWTVTALAAAAGFAQFLPFVRQQNVEWVLLLLPVHWALARVMEKPAPSARRQAPSP
jgi:hypothetical protein